MNEEAWLLTAEGALPAASHLLPFVVGIGETKLRVNKLASLMGTALVDCKFQEMFPMLTTRDEPVSWSGASTRLGNVLRRQGDPVWADLAYLRPSDLLRTWRNFGQLSLRELMGRGIVRSIETHVTTESTVIPEDVVPGVEESSEEDREPVSVGEAIDELMGSLSERELRVFLDRTLAPRPMKLEAIGKREGVTRERVRQIAKDVTKDIRQAIDADSRMQPIADAVAGLLLELGSACPESAFTRAVEDFVDGPMHIRFLRWLVGPTRTSHDWLVRDVRVDPFAPDPELLSGPNSLVGPLEEAVVSLNGLGVLPKFSLRWIADSPRFRLEDDQVIVWIGTVADKAVALLETWGKPASPEKLVEAIGEGHSLRASRHQIYSDPRIVRVTKSEVGLSAWGTPEYMGVVAAIDEEIRRWGGMAPKNQLSDAVVTRYGVSASSVSMYLATPRYITERRGVRLRTSQDEFEFEWSVERTPSLYRSLSGAIVWKVQVDGDVLRGSGRSIPEALAGWLNIGLNEIVSFGDVIGRNLEITWSDYNTSGPTIGSTRVLAQGLGLEVDDYLFIELSRDRRMASWGLKQSDLRGMRGMAAVAALTGYRGAEHEDLVHEVGWRIWEDADVTDVAALRRILNGREESSLADLALSEIGRRDETFVSTGLTGLFLNALGSAVIAVQEGDGVDRFPEVELRAPLPPRIRLYLFRARRDEKGRKTSSYRVQLTVGERSGDARFFSRDGDCTPLLAGYVDELDVFILWDAAMQEGGDGFPYSKSCYIDLETVLKATAHGVARTSMTLRKPTRVEWVVAARSTHLESALRERAMLSIESLLQT
jgi:hypothetical protein